MLLVGDVEVSPGPSLHDDTNFHSTTKGLKLFHLKIKVYMQNLSCKKVDILASLTETFLTDTTSYGIPGYTFITRIRISGSGGVFVFMPVMI